MLDAAQQLRLQQRGPGRYDVAGTSLRIYKVPATSTWRFAGSVWPATKWLNDAGLTDATFDTLRDARRTLTAHIALTPPPARRLPRLRRDGPGHHQTPDGGWTVTADTNRPGWRIFRGHQLIARRATLHQARQLISDHTPVQ